MQYETDAEIQIKIANMFSEKQIAKYEYQKHQLTHLNKMLLNILLLMLCLITGVSCKPTVSEGLQKTSEIIESNPDSAMKILYSIDTLKLSARDKAERRVQLSQAYILSGHCISNDSLIKPALDYYNRRGNSFEKAKAWYYYAKVQSDANNIDEAAKGFLEAAQYAEQSAKTTSVNQYLIAIYYNLGTLHSNQKYNDQAIVYFDKSIQLAKQLSNNYWLVSALLMKSMIQYSSHHYNDAIATLESIDSLSTDDLMREWSKLIILHYKVAGELEDNKQLMTLRNTINRSKIEKLMSEDNKHQWSDSPIFMYNTVSSLVFLINNQLDSASIYINKALREMNTPTLGSVWMYAIASTIDESRGHVNSALNYQKQYGISLDSIYQAEREVQVVSIEQRYHQKYESDLIIAKHRYRIVILILIAVILLCFAVFAINAYRKKLRKRDSIINDYLALIDSYKENHDGLLARLKTTNERESEIKEFLVGRFAIIKDIATTYYTYGESKLIVEKMKKLALSPSMLDEIIQITDFYNESAVTRLKEQLPNWTLRNYEFAALVIAGFSAQEISVMLDMTLNGVYTLKSKLKRRILESNAPNKEYFVEFFI